jgi:hypothetical protein
LALPGTGDVSLVFGSGVTVTCPLKTKPVIIWKVPRKRSFRNEEDEAGQWGTPGVLGLPVRANATHAVLVLSANAWAFGIFEMSGPAMAML